MSLVRGQRDNRIISRISPNIASFESSLLINFQSFAATLRTEDRASSADRLSLTSSLSHRCSTSMRACNMARPQSACIAITRSIICTIVCTNSSKATLEWLSTVTRDNHRTALCWPSVNIIALADVALTLTSALVPHSGTAAASDAIATCQQWMRLKSSTRSPRTWSLGVMRALFTMRST